MIECLNKPALLFLLLLIPYCVIQIINILKLKNIFSGKALQKTKKKKIIQMLCYALGFTLLICSLAKINIGYKEKHENISNVSITFLLDISKSMDSTDVNPSRLELSKAMIKLINNQLKQNDRSLIAFKNDAVLLIPPTRDTEIFNITLDRLSTRSLTSHGTDLQNALQLALKGVDNKKASIAIMLTDGEQVEGNIHVIANTIRTEQMFCFIIGVGTVKGAKIKIFDKDLNEQVITTALDENNLQQLISNLDDGVSCYFKYDTLNCTDIIINKIKNLQKGKHSIVVKEPNYLTIELLVLAFILFFIGYLYGEHQLKKTFPILCVLLFTGCKNEKLINFFGVQYYNAQQYSAATAEFYKAASINETAYIKYNIALCYAQSGESEIAQTKYESLTKSEENKIRSMAYFQMGVNYLKHNNPQLALPYFKEALKVDSKNINAKKNMEICLRQQQEVEKNKNKNNASSNGVEIKNEELIFDTIKNTEVITQWQESTETKKIPYDY